MLVPRRVVLSWNPLKVQERRAELAAALAPCTVCSLIFDEASYSYLVGRCPQTFIWMGVCSDEAKAICQQQVEPSFEHSIMKPFCISRCNVDVDVVNREARTLLELNHS